jgi:hypothetical protein
MLPRRQLPFLTAHEHRRGYGRFRLSAQNGGTVEHTRGKLDGFRRRAR